MALNINDTTLDSNGNPIEFPSSSEPIKAQSGWPMLEIDKNGKETVFFNQAEGIDRRDIHPNTFEQLDWE